MKALRPLLVFVVAVAVIFGVHLLQEATEYHGGAGAEAQTTVLFSIKDNDFGHGDAFAATALWQTCIATIGWTGEDEPAPAGERTYRAAPLPARRHPPPPTRLHRGPRRQPRQGQRRQHALRRRLSSPCLPYTARCSAESE